MLLGVLLLMLLFVGVDVAGVRLVFVVVDDNVVAAGVCCCC